MLPQGDRSEAAGSIEPAQREGLAGKEANTARFRGFHLKADPYRRPRGGPVTDTNLPRGAAVGESLDGPTLTTCALEQVGSYLGYTGRGAGVVAKAAFDP